MSSVTAVRTLAVMSGFVATGILSRALGRRRAACSPAFVAATSGPRTLPATALQLHAPAGAGPPSGHGAAGPLLTTASRLAVSAALGGALRLAGQRPKCHRPLRGYSVAARAQSEVSLIDFRVGEIVSAKKHPDSEKLLVEMINVGEDEPRQICSGIGAFLSPEEITGRRVVIVSNLKSRKMAGVPSEGMLLCASERGEGEGAAIDALVLVEAPAEAEVGERVVVEAEDGEHGEAAPPNRVAKKKLYEKVAPHLCTDGEGKVCFKAAPFMTSAGPCTAVALPKAVVS